jgi:transposase
MIGNWPDRAAMVKTVRGGVKLGSRAAIPEEIELYNRSTRCVAATWRNVRDFLWDHQAGPLLSFYPGLITSIRKHSRQIKQNLGIVEKKRSKKQAERAETMVLVRAARLKRLLAAEPQMDLFQQEFESA